ncbi:hypothetical protein MXD62_19835 [Frankia sp. Mgl5]|uniref:hypothetical protein n=1 Tax=Frankia sp. Mgl5 TaxID=2933793 RepID=UPI00200F79E7|nr:hypothetical protein [Frankia sp. Mgl5]MCK9929402.1 hypothetical protein [Frankia sp. Mgl5]
MGRTSGPSGGTGGHPATIRIRGIQADPHGTREQRRAARKLGVLCPAGCAGCAAKTQGQTGGAP